MMAEFYRQFAFVGSVLAGFSFTFYGTLLIAAYHPRNKRNVGKNSTDKQAQLGVGRALGQIML
jgi:hypothetical protein